MPAALRASIIALISCLYCFQCSRKTQGVPGIVVGDHAQELFQDHPDADENGDAQDGLADLAQERGFLGKIGLPVRGVGHDEAQQAAQALPSQYSPTEYVGFAVAL